MSDEPTTAAPPTGPPLTVGAWVVLAVVWGAGLVSWGVWVLLAGYVIWRFFGGSAQTS